MGNHIDTRGLKRKKVKEHDEMARRRRTSFKQYLRDIEEELLEDDLNADEDADTSENSQDE